MPSTPSNIFLKQIGAHEGIIHKVVSLYTDGKEDKEDLYQEILLQSWKSFANYKAEAQFSTWLYRVALNTALNFRRKYQKTEALTATQNLSDTEVSAGSGDKEMLYYIVKSLDEVDKMLITLHFEGYKNGEIAAITGMTTNYVNVKLHRIKTHIIHRFKSVCNES